MMKMKDTVIDCHAKIDFLKCLVCEATIVLQYIGQGAINLKAAVSEFIIYPCGLKMNTVRKEHLFLFWEIAIAPNPFSLLACFVCI